MDVGLLSKITRVKWLIQVINTIKSYCRHSFTTMLPYNALYNSACTANNHLYALCLVAPWLPPTPSTTTSNCLLFAWICYYFNLCLSPCTCRSAWQYEPDNPDNTHHYPSCWEWCLLIALSLYVAENASCSLQPSDLHSWQLLCVLEQQRVCN